MSNFYYRSGPGAADYRSSLYGGGRTRDRSNYSGRRSHGYSSRYNDDYEYDDYPSGYNQSRYGGRESSYGRYSSRYDRDGYDDYPSRSRYSGRESRYGGSSSRYDRGYQSLYDDDRPSYDYERSATPTGFRSSSDRRGQRYFEPESSRFERLRSTNPGCMVYDRDDPLEGFDTAEDRDRANARVSDPYDRLGQAGPNYFRRDPNPLGFERTRDGPYGDSCIYDRDDPLRGFNSYYDRDRAYSSVNRSVDAEYRGFRNAAEGQLNYGIATWRDV